MSYNVCFTKNFRKDVERCRNRGCDMERLQCVLDSLIDTGFVPPHCHPHKLSGNHEGEWECHVGPDWLLVWEQNDTELTLLMLSNGSHADLF